MSVVCLFVACSSCLMRVVCSLVRVIACCVCVVGAVCGLLCVVCPLLLFVIRVLFVAY